VPALMSEKRKAGPAAVYFLGTKPDTPATYFLAHIINTRPHREYFSATPNGFRFRHNVRRTACMFHITIHQGLPVMVLSAMDEVAACSTAACELVSLGFIHHAGGEDRGSCDSCLQEAAASRRGEQGARTAGACAGAAALGRCACMGRPCRAPDAAAAACLCAAPGGLPAPAAALHSALSAVPPSCAHALSGATSASKPYPSALSAVCC
jgi:hypothetical protein